MPRRAKTPCRHSGCAALLDQPGFCDKHRRETFKRQRQTMTPDKAEHDRFYHRVAWKKVRALQLQIEPLCRECRKVGKLTAATVVDHIIERSKGGGDYDLGNLRSVCVSCHNAITRRADGNT
ncbi:MAG: HNH endonuclease [Methylococcales bacterium]|nr:HNH endonuclease [Methylococcales bacterium]